MTAYRRTRVETVKLQTVNLEIAVMSDGSVNIYTGSGEHWAPVEHFPGNMGDKRREAIKLAQVSQIVQPVSWAAEALSKTTAGVKR